MRIGIVIALCAVALAMAALLPACKREAPTQQATGLRVVATTGMIADIARQIAGEHASVTALMGEGVDPHLYKASPGDIRLMSEADILLYNGLHLEGRLADAIVKLAGKVNVVRVTEGMDESQLLEPEAFEGHYDPHVWFDVSLWAKAAAHISQAFLNADPSHKDAYAVAERRLSDTLAQLHDYAKSTIATIPASQRVMVTAHDAFGYFGRAYGLEVLAIQGISTDSEASLQSINALVDVLVSRKVPAVFIESSVPRKTIDALVEGCTARGHALVIGGELFSDAMGPAGTPEGTYIGMLVHNVDTVTKALGGTVPAMKPPLVAEALRIAGPGRSGGESR